MQSFNTHLQPLVQLQLKSGMDSFDPKKGLYIFKKIRRVENICWGRQRTWENWTHGNNVGGFCQSPRLLARKQKLAPLSLYHIIYIIYHTSYLLAPKQRRTGPIVTISYNIYHISYNIFIGSQTKEAPLSLYHITYIVYHIYWPPNKNWPHCIVTISSLLNSWRRWTTNKNLPIYDAVGSAEHSLHWPREKNTQVIFNYQ